MEMRDIFKVTSVGISARLRDFQSQDEAVKLSTKRSEAYRGIARQIRGDFRDNLEGATLGYTKKAQAYFSQELQREYTY